MRIQTRPHSVYLSENLSKNYKIINSPPSPGGTIDSGFYSISGNNDDKQNVLAVSREEEDINNYHDNNSINNSDDDDDNNNINSSSFSSSPLTEKNNFNLSIYNKFHTLGIQRPVIRDRRSLPVYNRHNGVEDIEKNLPVIDMSELTKKWSDWFEPSVLNWLNETKNPEVDINLSFNNKTVTGNIYDTSFPLPPPKIHSKDGGNNTENDKTVKHGGAPRIELPPIGRPFSLKSIQSILSGNPEEDVEGDGKTSMTLETMTPDHLVKIIEDETVTTRHYNGDVKLNDDHLSPYDTVNKKSSDLESIILSTEFSEKSHQVINVRSDAVNNNEIINNDSGDTRIISEYLFWAGFLILPLWWFGSFYIPNSTIHATSEDYYRWRNRCRKATLYSSIGLIIIIVATLAIFLI